MKYLVFSLLYLALSYGYAQSVTELTLDECIDIAMESNLDIKRSRNNELIARANQLQAVMSHLPEISAGFNYDYFVGTTFDVNAARQVSATTNSSNPNIQGRMTLFNGLTIHNQRRQSISAYSAAQKRVEDAKLSTEADVLTAYLNTLLGEENIKISSERVGLLEAQLDRAVKRESVGVGNLEEVYNFRSQLANEKLNFQTLQNTYQQNMLILLQSMRLDPSASNYQLVPVTATEDELLAELSPFDQVLSECIQVNPAVMAAESSLDAARFQFKSTWGQQLPRVSVFGMVGSNYSSNGAVNPEKPFFDPDSGDPGFNFEPDATFLQQMGYNQFEYLNFSVNIPIFSQLRGSTSIQNARLSMDNAKIDHEIALQTITNLVQQVYLDLVAAQATYKSAIENLDALQQTYAFMKKRFETGNTDFYTYLESLNNKNRAEIQLINAKYSIILRNKVLDAYRMK